VHGVGSFVVGNARGVCGVGLVCIAAAKSDGYDALAGVDERAAAVGHSDVGIVVGVAQPNRLTVLRFGNFKGIRPLAKHGTGYAGDFYIRPIAVIPAWGAALYDDKPTLVALGVIDIVRTIGIIAVVYDFVSSICLAFNLVLVVPAIGDIALPNRIPLENLKLGIALDALLGFTVDFVDADFYRPLIVFHLVIVRAVGRNRNSLVAAQRAGRGIKTVRDGDFIIAEFQIIEVTMYSRQRGFNFSVDLTFAGALRGGLCRRCLCVCILLTVGSYAAALGCRLADAVMHRPCGKGIAAIEVVTVVLRVTACGHRLLA